uniref:Uncharacterized protein n=1 Tax=Timema cristinae TaxID=61476 RepID=A0A7R9D8E2_TIMCR|nr:unnamed protein product [Timema cristinae]
MLLKAVLKQVKKGGDYVTSKSSALSTFPHSRSVLSKQFLLQYHQDMRAPLTYNSRDVKLNIALLTLFFRIYKTSKVIDKFHKEMERLPFLGDNYILYKELRPRHRLRIRRSVVRAPCSWSIRNSTRDYSLRNHVTVSINEIRLNNRKANQEKSRALQEKIRKSRSIS